MSKLISPLGDVYPAGVSGASPSAGPSIEIQELRPQGMSSVQAWPDTLEAVNAILMPLADKNCDVLSIGAGNFLVIDWDGKAADVIGTLNGGMAAVSDVGNARSVVRLSGGAASRLLMKGIAIDMDETVTPIGSALQSSIHGIGVIVRREAASAFVILCNRGYAQSFWHWLTDEGAEFGVKILPSRF